LLYWGKGVLMVIVYECSVVGCVGVGDVGVSVMVVGVGENKSSAECSSQRTRGLAAKKAFKCCSV
jgi:fructose-1-phosphate kinase PfkB-like protein